MAPRFLLLFTGAVLVGLPFLSGEPAPSAEVSIESAKRDFETMRGATNLAPESQLKLPQINASQMTRPEGSVPAPSATRRQSLREKQQKERDENWLLDAMLEQPEDADEIDTLKKEQEALTADPFEQMIAEQLSPTKERKNEEAQFAEADALEDQVVNPLAAFMSAWVSERDRELLIPENKRADHVAWFSEEGRGAVVPTTTTDPFYNKAARRVGDLNERVGEVSNPYLYDQIPVFDEPPQPSVPNHFHQENLEALPHQTVEPHIPTRSAAPSELPMNRNEESKKYFPQLKRF